MPVTRLPRLPSALAAAALLAAPAQLAAAPWQPAQRIAPGGAAAEPRVAVDVFGNAIAVWRAPDGGVRSSVRLAADGRWSKPQRVSLPGERVDPGSLRLVVDRVGNATAAWTQTIAGTGRSAVEAAIRLRTRDYWQEPKEISGPQMAIAGSTRLAVAPNNAAVLAWEAPLPGGTPDQSAVRAAFRPAARGNFAAPRDLSPPGVPALRPDVAISPQDDALATWVTAAGTVQVSERLAGTDWSAPQDVVALPGTDPDVAAAWVAMGPRGQGAVLVRAALAGTPGQHILRAVWRTQPGAPWGALEEVENLDPADELGEAAIGIGPDGEATMVANHLFPAGEQLDAAVRPAGGAGWDLPVRIGTADTIAGLSLAVDRRRCSVTAWTGESGEDAAVFAVTRCQDRDFNRPDRLSARGERAGAPHVGVSPRGEAVVIWSGSRGVRAAYLTSRRPRVSRFRVQPASFRRGTGPKLRFRLTMPAQVTFTVRRADGRRLGSLVRHGVRGDNAIEWSGGLRRVPLPAGSYVMEMRASDGVSTDTARARFRITP